MIVVPGISVFHGSYCEVTEPDLEKCRHGKDFGRGFYVTTSRSQALRFIRTSVKKAVAYGTISTAEADHGFISEYIITDRDFLSIYEFDTADADWLHCVAGYRKRGMFSNEIFGWDKYDVIAGKIANDNTNLVISAYIDGAYGAPGTDRADRIAIEFLEPDNLKDQICFRTDAGISKLGYSGSERIDI